MKFRLFYRGNLKVNGKPKDKHALRKAFHVQLMELWEQEPLSSRAEDFLKPDYKLSAIKQVQGQQFSSIVNSVNNLVAKLDITFLRPEEPGRLVTQGGDIDNRLKTLLDGLSIPKEGQITKESQFEDQKLLHCLLEDDNLITGLSVEVDRLLDSQDELEVVLIIHVTITATRVTLQNLGIIS